MTRRWTLAFQWGRPTPTRVPRTRRRFRRSRIPVRSFSRAATNHPGARPCTPPARQHNSFATMPHPKIRITHVSPHTGDLALPFPENKANKPLIGFGRPKMRTWRVHPPRTKPHNSAQQSGFRRSPPSAALRHASRGAQAPRSGSADPLQGVDSRPT